MHGRRVEEFHVFKSPYANKTLSPDLTAEAVAAGSCVEDIYPLEHVLQFFFHSLRLDDSWIRFQSIIGNQSHGL